MSKTTISSQDVRDTSLTDADVATANKDGAAATAGMRTLGTPALTLGTANAAATSGAALGVASTILAFDATVPVTQALGDTAAAGTATVAARRDHKHAITNPMTTAGDLIVGGSSGAATVLHKGTALQALTIDPSTVLPVWAPVGGYTCYPTDAVTPGSGIKAFTVPFLMGYVPGLRVVIQSIMAPTAWMEGLISSYTGSTLNVQVDTFGGTGSHSDYGITMISDKVWTAPSLLNSWVNLGSPYATAGYRIDAVGVVHLRGLVKSGTIGLTIFTLPVDYRASQEYIFVVASAGPSYGEIRVDTAGNVNPQYGSTGWMSLDGICFVVG